MLLVKFHFQWQLETTDGISGTWDIDIDIHQTQMKDNTSTPFFNGVKRAGWSQNCSQCSLQKTTSLQSRPSPRKGRENREKTRERERRTYQSGPQGKPDPARVLTCLISMSRTQPSVSAHSILAPHFWLIYKFQGTKKPASNSHLIKDASPFCLFFFLSLEHEHTQHLYAAGRDPQISAALLRSLCILHV